MKAMVISRFGGPEVLQAGEIERPHPAPGHVVIEVAYAGVNPADWKGREGWLARYFDYQFPFVLGFDAAGVVREVGEGVTQLAVGDRVVAASNQGLGERGSYAEFVHAAAERTVRLPASIGLKEACTLPTAGMTAYEATLDNGRAGPDSRVFVHGGAGGTGSFAIQLARMAGAQVATTCSAHNADYVRALGAELVIDYRHEDVYAALKAWAPEGLDVVVDTVGQGTLVDILPVMKRGGRVAPIGTLIPDEAAIDPVQAQADGVDVMLTVSSFPNQPRQLRALVAALADGRLRAPDITVLPLDEAAEAHRRVQEGHVRGKILLAVNPALDEAVGTGD